MNIYDRLSKDHDEVKTLLADLIALDDDESDQRNRVVREIRDALIPHSRAEESVFYNSIRALNTEKSEVMHGFTEHMQAEALLRTLQVEAKTGIGWRGTAEKLKESLEHHIEEEEGTIFSIAHRLFTEDEAVMMGRAFERMKPEIKDDGFMKNAIDMVANLMPPRMRGSVKDRVQDLERKAAR